MLKKWLKNALIKITKLDQEEAVTTGHIIPGKENTKGTSASG
jgi:hypothetical protein